MRELLAEAQPADTVGLDVFAVGEYHRPDFIASAPEVILGAVAATKRSRLISAVAVLSSTDSVRTFQNFVTVDLISGGRAGILAGRGSFYRVVSALRLRPPGLRRPICGEAESAF